MIILAALLTIANPAADDPPAMPTCEGADDCAAKWGRALRWVMDRNPVLVEQSESLIRTGPAAYAVANFYQVTRIPDGGGRYTIDLRIGCANELWGCKWKAEKRAFTAHVMASPVRQ